MSCLIAIIPLLVWLIVLCVIVGLVKLILPKLLAKLGDWGPTIVAGLNIILWGAIGIFVVYFFAELLICLFGLPSFPHLR